jgi:AraC-like DNA-binding protein
LTPDTIRELAVPGEAVAEQVATLVALAIGKSAAVPMRGKDKLLARIRQTLMERAHDDSLSPLSVAAENGISKRYLHVLFASAGSTFSQELVAIRLERARVLLGDARFANLTVSEIAWRCGFADSSHFARRFYRAYGKSPTAYRRVHS